MTTANSLTNSRVKQFKEIQDNFKVRTTIGIQPPTSLYNSQTRREEMEFTARLTPRSDKQLPENRLLAKHSLDNLNANKQNVVGFVLRVLGLQPSNA